jgi:Membrane protein involved in the export of O-antigen and teichoic acid
MVTIITEKKHKIIKSVTLLQATAQSIAAGVGGQLLLVISGPLVARILGVEGRGYLAALYVWPGMLAALGTLGIPVACSYFLNSEPGQAGRILGVVYRMAIAQAVILTAILGAFLFWWGRGKPEEVQVAIYPTLLIIPAGLAQEYALAVLQGKQRFSAFNAMRLLPALLYAICVVILFLLRENRLFIVVLLWVSTFLLAGVTTTIVALRQTRIDWNIQSDLRRQIRKFGLRGHIGAIAPVDSLRLDQLAASIFLAPAALGIYVVGYAFTNLPRFISQSAGMVAYPAIAQRQGFGEKERLVWLYFWGITLTNCAISAILIVAMPFLVVFFFGKEFLASVSIAQILLVGTTFAASRRILVEGLRGHGYPQVSSLAEVSMYPWLLTGGAFLMWVYGVKGLAIGVTIGYALSLAVALVVWKRKGTSLSMAVTLGTGMNVSGTVDSYEESQKL